jgi:ssDNA-binding Zn-finger/Zn-ribbon topoisomerase 1
MKGFVTAKELGEMKFEAEKCPDCGGPMAERNGEYGFFYGCKRYPECRGTRDHNGESKSDRERWQRHSRRRR